MSNRRHRSKPIDTPAAIERPGLWERLSTALGLGRSGGPVCVAEVRSTVEADMIEGFLRTNGINAHVLGDDAGRTNPIYTAAFGVRVLVPADQEDEARRLLAEADDTATNE